MKSTTNSVGLKEALVKATTEARGRSFEAFAADLEQKMMYAARDGEYSLRALIPDTFYKLTLSHLKGKGIDFTLLGATATTTLEGKLVPASWCTINWAT